MLLSKSSGRDKGRTYCNKKQIIIICFQKMCTIKEIYYILLITLMNVCRALTPPKSPFLVKIFCMFDENSVGNLIFWMTSFTILLCCSIYAGASPSISTMHTWRQSEDISAISKFQIAHLNSKFNGLLRYFWRQHFKL